MKLVTMWVRLIGAVLVITVFFNSTHASSYCDKVQQKYSPGRRYVRVQGSTKNISLYWGSDPAYAATVLFDVILRYAHGYQNVYMRKGDHNLTVFANNTTFNIYGSYDDVILALSTAWDPTNEPKKKYEVGYSTGFGAPRLQEIDLSRVPASLRLHVHLPTTFQGKEPCTNFAHWQFYSNDTALQDCGFTGPARNENAKNATVYIIQDSNNESSKVAETLETRAKTFLLFLQFKKLDRQSLFEMLKAGSSSFLFIDYDMWVGTESNVNAIQVLPCLSNDLACLPTLDSTIGLRVADMFLLGEHASQLFELAHVFNPPIEFLKFILAQNKNDTLIKEAACEWVSKNFNNVTKEWVEKYESKKKKFEIAVFFARGSEENRYDRLLFNVSEEISQQLNLSYSLVLRRYSTDYFKISFVKDSINEYMTHRVRQRLIGAVVGGDNNITEIVEAIDQMGIPVLLYDVATVDADSTKSVWLSAGRLAHLAIAVKHFIHSNNWKRVAVLSDKTHTSDLFLEDLRQSNLSIRDHSVNLSDKDVKKVLEQIKYENAYIIVVNTRYQEAITILTAAAELEMNIPDYVWIVREWEQCNESLNATFFTLSFWYPSGDEALSKHSRFQDTIQEYMNYLWPDRNKLPRSAAALVDAVWAMAEGFQHVFLKYPEAREDTHTTQTIRQFGRSLVDLSPIKAFTQNLVFKGHSLEETDISLNKWFNGTRKTLARWRVNATSKEVDVGKTDPSAGPAFAVKPSDGTKKCVATTGNDPYDPTCLDPYCISLFLFVIFALPVGVLIYRAFQRHLKKLQTKIITDLLAQRMERAATLSSYLVDRSALKPREELGAGRFGCVRLADLHVPGCKARVVAAKELRDHQDGSEILREACILASLKHDNIIRLVGVCIDNEPTLVLMEVAFFGDLLQYLKDRRYIAEGAAFDAKAEEEQISEEAAHVSARSLTRLAREAASALAFLALRGVIHRDLRASNCLVDQRRSLKLADFGLARETKANGLDGGGEYACRRRGLFPVLWMAPESLQLGVFSTASDVYSLGMLIFELVTLGARPYGKISPLRVMQYVTSGGMPRMPADATPQATGLAQLCWQRQPERRPTAADLVVYLAEHPSALSPALDENNQPTDADSGYGESPSTEMLIPE